MGGSIPVSISLPISLPIFLALALVLALALALERLHILMEPSLLDTDVATPGFFFFYCLGFWVFSSRATLEKLFAHEDRRCRVGEFPVLCLSCVCLSGPTCVLIVLSQGEN